MTLSLDRRRQGQKQSGTATWRIGLLCALFLLAAGQLAAQQRASVSGTVTDQAGEQLSDVALTLTPSSVELAATRTVLTDTAGSYRFDGIIAGSYTIEARRLGYVATEVSLSLRSGDARIVNLSLVTDTLQLRGVVVRGVDGADRERARFREDAGVTANVVDIETLRALPGLGEPDVLRAVQLLPGVISTSDFSSSYNVRGGSSDENLILLDGFTVFNPFHLGGLFSVFNSDAVARAELLAGGFGAEFGGRVSSVLNIETRSDVPEEVEFHGGVSLLASRLLVRTPLPDGLASTLGGSGGSAFIAARRSYFDQLLRPVANFPYHLTDLQTHVSMGTPNGGTLSFTGYTGEDVLDLSSLGDPEGDDAADVLRLRWDWGNQVAGVHWVQPAGDWIVDSRLGYSRFAERLGFLDFADVRFAGRIVQRMLRSDLKRNLSPELSLAFGLGASWLEHANVAAGGGSTFLDTAGDGLLGSAYASAQWRPSKWIVEPGVRFDSWRGDDVVRNVTSPRLAVKRFFGADENVALKFAAGRYSQFLHSLRDEQLPISNDTWVLADASTPAIISDQVQLGIESFWGDGWSASAEAYARSFDGVTDLNATEDPNDPADDLLVGDGLSYGLDLELKRSRGRLSGWMSLSLLRAERTFPDPLAVGWADVPTTVTYPPIFDRHVNFDLILQYEATDRLELSARWNYGSGLPYTRPVAQVFAWRHDPENGGATPLDTDFDGDGEIPVAVVLGARNAQRYPPYHRLDVTVRRTFERRWGTFVPYLQILNVYNRRNVLFYFFDYDSVPPVRSGFSMFPLLPSIGVEVNF